MTDRDNEETFDNEEQEPHKGYEEDTIAKTLRETHEKIRERNSQDYEESLDLADEEEENEENDALEGVESEKQINKEDDAEVVATDENTEEAATERSSDDFPSTWKGHLKDKWATVDPDVKAEIHRREGDMLKGLEQYRSYATYGTEVAKAFQPYDAQIKAAGMNQKQVLDTALNSMYVLSTGSPEQRANELLNIARTYGVELDQVSSVNDRLLANEPLVDPVVEQLKQENQQILSYLEQSNKEKQQHEIQTYQSELEQFANDPENRYFDDVREEMALIFGSSQEELTLKEVYDKAVWANPVTREKLLAEQREAERRSAAEKAAAAKKTAKTNVAAKGRPLTNAKAEGTLEDTIESTWAQIRARR